MKLKSLALAAALFCGAATAQQVLPPFAPWPSATASVAVTGSAQALTLPTSGTSITGINQFVVTNVGTQTVFFRCDGTTATAGNGMPSLSNSQFLITVPASQLTCSVIAGATGSTLYATGGLGQ